MQSLFSTLSRLSSSRALRPLGVVVAHTIIALGIGSALYDFGVIQYSPFDPETYNHFGFQWDMYWYERVKREGYTYSATTTSTVAFFPLLPYAWRYLSLDAAAMGLFNWGVFLGAYAWLAHAFRVRRRLALLLLSFPSLLFTTVAYTESFFFLFSTALLIGLHRRQPTLLLSGIFLAGLTRAAGTLFLPSLALTAVVLIVQGERRAAWWVGAALGALVVATGLVVWFQFKATGVWFAFAKAHVHWGHKLQVPHLPLISLGVHELWLDALAFWVGGAAAASCVGAAIRVIGQWHSATAASVWQRLPTLPTSPAVVFSLGYCACAAGFTLLLQGGNISNTGRYILATPFIVVLVNFISTTLPWSRTRYGVLLGSAALLWTFFGAFGQMPTFTPGQSIWYFGLTTIYLTIYLATYQFRWSREAMLPLYVLNLVLQLHLLNSFLQHYLIE